MVPKNHTHPVRMRIEQYLQDTNFVLILAVQVIETLVWG